MNNIITGSVWKCGNDITAYKIIAQKRWTMNTVDREELGKWAFEGAYPEVADIPFGFKNKGYDIVIAGHDFGGGGKSIEHPIVAIQGVGVKLVLAESFARYTFRNAINLGLPAITCPGITGLFEAGDKLEADLLTGEIKNLTSGRSIRGTSLSDQVLMFLEAGDMLSYYRKLLSKEPKEA